MNLVERNLQILTTQSLQLKTRQTEIQHEVERLQRQRQKLAYPAKVARNPAAIDELAEVETKIRQFWNELEDCGFAQDEITARMATEEAKRADVEEMEREFAEQEKARLGLAAQLDTAVEDLAKLVSAYHVKCRTCGDLSRRLEKPDAAKYGHTPGRLYRLIYGHLNSYMSAHFTRPGGGGLRCSLVELEAGKSIELTKPEVLEQEEATADAR